MNKSDEKQCDTCINRGEAITDGPGISMVIKFCAAEYYKPKSWPCRSYKPGNPEPGSRDFRIKYDGGYGAYFPRAD